MWILEELQDLSICQWVLLGFQNMVHSMEGRIKSLINGDGLITQVNFSY